MLGKIHPKKWGVQALKMLSRQSRWPMRDTQSEYPTKLVQCPPIAGWQSEASCPRPSRDMSWNRWKDCGSKNQKPRHLFRPKNWAVENAYQVTWVLELIVVADGVTHEGQELNPKLGQMHWTLSPRWMVLYKAARSSSTNWLNLKRLLPDAMRTASKLWGAPKSSNQEGALKLWVEGALENPWEGRTGKPLRRAHWDLVKRAH